MITNSNSKIVRESILRLINILNTEIHLVTYSYCCVLLLLYVTAIVTASNTL